MTPDQLIAAIEDAEVSLRDLKEGARYGEDIAVLLERLNTVSNVLAWVVSGEAQQPEEVCDEIDDRD